MRRLHSLGHGAWVQVQHRLAELRCCKQARRTTATAPRRRLRAEALHFSHTWQGPSTRGRQPPCASVGVLGCTLGGGLPGGVPGSLDWPSSSPSSSHAQSIVPLPRLSTIEDSESETCAAGHTYRGFGPMTCQLDSSRTARARERPAVGGALAHQVVIHGLFRQHRGQLGARLCRPPIRSGTVLQRRRDRLSSSRCGKECGRSAGFATQQSSKATGCRQRAKAGEARNHRSGGMTAVVPV